MKTTRYNNPAVGCYVDESSGSADDCNLRTIEFAEDYGFEYDLSHEARDPESDDEKYESQRLSETADEALTFLNEQETRSYMYWTHEDNSLFLCADVDSAREECEFVSAGCGEYPDTGFRGEWLHVSDHGNATLYVRGDNGEDREVWSVV